MRQKGIQTRDLILTQATELFRRQGFGATSIQDLLRSTGVNRGSLYFHFPGKDDLAVAVLERHRDEFLAFVASSLRGDSPGRRLDRFFREALKAHRDSGFVGGCFWGNTALEMADREPDPRYLKIVRDVFRQWKAMLAEVVKEAQKTREVQSRLPAADLATHIVASLEGGIMLARLQKVANPLQKNLDLLRHTLQLKPKPVRAAMKGAAE
jgi:TetR/AcrR family transcriptional repressor of nem operon